MPTTDNPDNKYTDRVEHKKTVKDGEGMETTTTLWNTVEEILPIEIELFVDDAISDGSGNDTLGVIKSYLDNTAKLWYYAGTVETGAEQGDLVHHFRAFFNPAFFILFDGANGWENLFKEIMALILDDGVTQIFYSLNGQMRRVELIDAG